MSFSYRVVIGILIRIVKQTFRTFSCIKFQHVSIFLFLSTTFCFFIRRLAGLLGTRVNSGKDQAHCCTFISVRRHRWHSGVASLHLLFHYTFFFVVMPILSCGSSWGGSFFFGFPSVLNVTLLAFPCFFRPVSTSSVGHRSVSFERSLTLARWKRTSPLSLSVPENDGTSTLPVFSCCLSTFFFLSFLLSLVGDQPEVQATPGSRKKTIADFSATSYKGDNCIRHIGLKNNNKNTIKLDFFVNKYYSSTLIMKHCYAIFNATVLYMEISKCVDED